MRASATARRGRGTRWTAGMAVVSLAALTMLTAGGVFAALRTTSAATQGIASGTLALQSTAGPGVGLASAITGLAPGARVNRFLKLTNGGSVAAGSVTMGATGSATPLTGVLLVSVDSCSTPWSVAFACSGTLTSLAANTPLNTILSGSPVTIASSLAPGGTVNLRVGVSVPATALVTTDGVVTYQGTTASITWAFTQQQAAGAATNS